MKKNMSVTSKKVTDNYPHAYFKNHTHNVFA